MRLADYLFTPTAMVRHTNGVSSTLALGGLLVGLVLLAGCSSSPEALKATDKKIELSRFMGDWYVIGSIPIDYFFASEAGGHNAVESYELKEDGSIDTRYRFRQDSFDGPLKSFNPTGFVYNTETNAEWRMQFLWPFKSAYLITYLSDDYSQTIIGVPNRDYIWIMSRTPEVSEDEYQRLLQLAIAAGYDPESIVRIPHAWPEATEE
jgi:apolipoprotein D and lipocalin family protein